MTLKQIKALNIQCHKDLTIDLPEFGLVRLCGPNSAGKSVVIKVISLILENKIVKPKTRAALISRGSSFGEITYTRYDDWSLSVHLTVEASTTYITLTNPEGEKTVRYLADKNHKELLNQFGFHYNENRNISLNIAEGDKSILFYTTSDRTNGEIVAVALTDERASSSLEGLETLLKDTRSFRDTAQTSITIIDNAMYEMKEYDTVALAKKEAELLYCYNILSSIYVPVIPEVDEVPRVNLLSVYTPALPEVKYPPIVNLQCNIPDITGLAEELHTLKNNKCPTCGRLLNES